ncbi:39S ribosomal protein L28, mitochondrial [Aplysia californica]|uniref:Large ribosomal subunit protein bL28m n=1 Tax=Aplysia californica TaxID=6500 RepID=A0ABM0JGF5_APLCA|nr:39S ribosomal protein L28, mitochondrial [Aplysia californica]
MEKVKIRHFMPSIKMYKDMVQHEVTYFQYHNNTRFTISSRLIKTPGLWVNHWRSVPYVYRWSPEEERILPEHYKNSCREFMTKEPEPVHWRPDPQKYWEDIDSGQRFPVINAPIPVVYPKECNTGLWGGEGIIFGYFTKVDPKRQKKLPTRPRIWLPELMKRVLYSEILDRYMAIMITARAQYLIDEAFGLDNYILQTHEVDLCSRLAMTLKREMLLALANKSLYSDNPVKKEKIYKKYEKFVIPAEEAEWIGLPMYEAVEKAKALEEELYPPQPLKDLYLVDLVRRLKLSASAS